MNKTLIEVDDLGGANDPAHCFFTTLMAIIEQTTDPLQKEFYKGIMHGRRKQAKAKAAWEAKHGVKIRLKTDADFCPVSCKIRELEAEILITQAAGAIDRHHFLQGIMHARVIIAAALNPAIAA